MTRKKQYLSISAVAKLFAVHQQTIRFYEKEGLLNPKRSSGNTRLFSANDIKQLEEIIYLTHQLGVNLAGVELILRLQNQIKKLQREMNKAFAETQAQLSHEVELNQTALKTHAQQLAKLKKAPPAKKIDSLPAAMKYDEQ